MTSLQKLKHDLAQHTTDRNTFRDIFELKVEGKRVLMFQVPAAPRGIPMGWKGHFYARRGESLAALDMSKYEEIRRQTSDFDWSKQIVDGATIADSISDEAIKMLRKEKLIEGRKPHLYVSKQIAQVTDQKVAYSKHKGLAEKKCEALLVDSLKDHGDLTKQEIVNLLWDVLPDQLDDKQKMNKIEYLLKRLKMRGDIKNDTSGKTSIYSLGK